MNQSNQSNNQSNKNSNNNSGKPQTSNDKLPRLDHTEMCKHPISEEVKQCQDKVFKSIWPYHMFDDKECNQKIMRPTIRTLARQKELYTKMGIPLGIVCQPFHELSESEPQVPVVDIFQKNHIPRCNTCQAYINP